MMDEFGEIFVAGVLVLLLLLVTGGALALFENSACLSRWERSGMKATWGVFQGCQVEVEPGKWLPEKALRRFEG
jgi:hypothetical protein